MARKKRLADPAGIDDDTLEGVGALDPADKTTLSQRCFRQLEEALETGDIDKARVADLTLRSLNKSGDRREAPRLRADEKFVLAIRAMAVGEFKIPSRLAGMIADMKAAEAASLADAEEAETV